MFKKMTKTFSKDVQLFFKQGASLPGIKNGKIMSFDFSNSTVNSSS
jgi:hypothetical protein